MTVIEISQFAARFITSFTLFSAKSHEEIPRVIDRYN